MGNPIVALIVEVYVVAFAVRKRGLDKRLALGIMSVAGASAGGMLLAVMTATFVFTFFIPTATGRCIATRTCDHHMEDASLSTRKS